MVPIQINAFFCSTFTVFQLIAFFISLAIMHFIINDLYECLWLTKGYTTKLNKENDDNYYLLTILSLSIYYLVIIYQISINYQTWWPSIHSFDRFCNRFLYEFPKENDHLVHQKTIITVTIIIIVRLIFHNLYFLLGDTMPFGDNASIKILSSIGRVVLVE